MSGELYDPEKDGPIVQALRAPEPYDPEKHGEIASHLAQSPMEDLRNIGHGLKQAATSVVTDPAGTAAAVGQGVWDVTKGLASKALAIPVDLVNRARFDNEWEGGEGKFPGDKERYWGGGPERLAVEREYQKAKRAHDERAANTIGAHLTESYGSLPKIKESVLKRPFSTALDAATVLSGGEMLPGRIGLGFSAASKAIDPITNAQRLLTTVPGYATSAVLGKTSGAGGGVIRQAYRDSAAGGEQAKAFRENYTGAADAEDLRQLGDSALTKMGDSRRSQYLANKELWAGDAAHLDFAPVMSGLSEAQKKVLFGGLPTSDRAVGTLSELNDIVNTRRLQPQARNIPDALPSRVAPRVSDSGHSMMSGPAATITTPETMVPGSTILPSSFNMRPSPMEEMRANLNLRANKASGRLTATEVPRYGAVEVPGQVIPDQVVPGTSITVKAVEPSVGAAFDDLVRRQDAVRAGAHAPRINSPRGNGEMGPFGSPHYTPEGFDRMKQAVGDLMYDSNRAPEGSLSRNIAGDVYNRMKDEIVRQSPSYAKAMSDYEQASKKLREMQKTFSLAEGSSTDTAARKLLSTARHNVTSNFGYRDKLMKELAQKEPTLPSAIAGQTLNSWQPRGLVANGHMSAAAMVALLHNPALLAAIPAFSPKVAGGAAYAAGLPARGMSAAGINAERLRAAALAAGQTGRIPGLLEQ